MHSEGPKSTLFFNCFISYQVSRLLLVQVKKKKTHELCHQLK